MTTTLNRPGSTTERGSISEITSNLSPAMLKEQAHQIVENILPKVNHDPLYHIWNDLNAMAVNDPKAKYIVDMVNSRSFQLQSFVGKTLESFYGGEGTGTPGGGGSGGSGGGGGSFSN